MYDIPAKFTYNGFTIGRLSLTSKTEFHIPEGLKVKVGENEYILVNDFVEDTKNLPISYLESVVYSLYEGTMVEMENGIVQKLYQRIDVDFQFSNNNIVLKSGTKLQQTDSPIQLVLYNEQIAKIVQKVKDKPSIITASK